MSLVHVDDATLRCSIHGIDVRKGRACPSCAVEMHVAAETVVPGHFEALTDEATAAGMPGRLEAERILWARAKQMSDLAAELDEERRAIPGKGLRDRS